MAARGKTIIFYRCNFFTFLYRPHRWKTSHGSSPKLTWPVGRKWCRFTNASQNIRGPQIWGPKISNFDHFFATSALDTAYLRNVTSHRQTKMLMSVYNVSPKRWPTFCNLWPRNGWNPFHHCDLPFGGHYVATIIVATCLIVKCLTRYDELTLTVQCAGCAQCTQ